MSQQPQGPGWWQASDGRWYPPQQQPYQPQQQYPPAQQQYAQQPYAQQPAPRRSGNRGCLIAALVVVAIVLVGGGVAAYFVYQAVHKVAEVASGVTGGVSGGVGTLGDAKCPTEQQVGAAVGSPVELKVQGSVVVASGCSYLATDRDRGADVQITTGLALVADDEIKSFASDAATQDASVDPVPIGDRGQSYGGQQRSAALTVSDGKLIEVEITSADQPIGDHETAAVALLQMVVAAG